MQPPVPPHQAYTTLLYSQLNLETPRLIPGSLQHQLNYLAFCFAPPRAAWVPLREGAVGSPRGTLLALTGPTFSLRQRDLTPAAISVADTPECPANDLCRVLEKFKFPGKCLEGRLHSSRRITREIDQIVLDTIGIGRLLSGSSTTDNRVYCKRPSPNLAYVSPRGITEDSRAISHKCADYGNGSTQPAGST